MKKKMLAALAASVMLCGVLSAPASAAEYKKGDVNMDGKISVTDAQLALKEYTEYLVAGNEHFLTPEELELAEIDGKINDKNPDRISAVTAADARAILVYYTDALADESVKERDIVDYLREYHPYMFK